MSSEERDDVDAIVTDWRRERPDLDFAPFQVFSRIGRLAKHLDRERKTAFQRSNLDAWEFDVLAALRRSGEPYRLSPKALMEQTLVSSGTMTNRIDRLVGRRLVRREDDPSDGRSVLVVLTEEGKTRVDAAITRLVDAETTLLQRLPRSERTRLADLLRRLGLALGPDGK